jgi:alkylation response protein AidB-like acyl-CoA dehydrogenase
VEGTDWVVVARELGPGVASRAAAYDANDSFPLENYWELKERRVFGAPVPAALGAGGIFRSLGLERLVRDIHAAQFHPLQAKRQHRFTGHLALGLDPLG